MLDTLDMPTNAIIIIGVWVIIGALYSGLGAHMVSGVLLQFTFFSVMYPYIHGYFYNRDAQNTVNPVEAKKITKIIRCMWTLTRHIVKTMFIMWIWKSCMFTSVSKLCADFDIHTVWLQIDSHGPRGAHMLNPTKTGAIVFYYACIADWFGDYYMYTKTWKDIGVRPKDYNVMQWHHVVTVLLMGGSVLYGHFPAGIYILFVHEWTDIFVSVLKIIKASNSESKYIVPWFVLNLVIWLSVRVIIFPTWIIYPLWLHTQSTFIQILVVFLVVLWCMHVFWFCLMVWMGLSLLSKTPRQVAAMYDCDDMYSGIDNVNVAIHGNT